MRSTLVTLHRWFGLFTAAFLIISGLTGAVISWDHELDEWLNPHLYRADWVRPPGASLALADQLEAERADLIVTYLPLVAEPGRALTLSVEPRSGFQPTPDFNQVALNPTTGAVQGERMWGAASLSRENLLPFLYKLHYSMHIPDLFGVETGVWFMGVVGIVWFGDCLVALAVSFPSPRAWRKSLALRWRLGGFRLLFDVHRSGGVWLWLLLAIVAVTSVSMNLGSEVVRPVVGTLSPLSPSPFDVAPLTRALAPAIDRQMVVAQAVRDAAMHSIDAPPGAIFYSPQYHVFGVGFFAPGAEHGDGGLGNPWLYYDATDGARVGADIPGAGSAGDLFMHAQFPLHSGRIAGVFGRVVVSLLGLAVATLSVTGIVIWSRKRASRRLMRGPLCESDRGADPVRAV